jgi:hypothetical protein
VLYVDGEMNANDIQERLNRLCELLQVPADAADNLTFVGADWQDGFLPRLDTPEGQAALDPFVEQADLIVLDNRSCLFDPEGEKDATAWQPAQDWLLSLRRRGKAVLGVHHSNRQGGARGHSKAEDALDVAIKLSRPDDYSAEQGARFLIEFDKARGIHGKAVMPFIAKLSGGGWVVEEIERASGDAIEMRIREYLRLAAEAGDSPKSANAALRAAGVNRNRGLKVWGRLFSAKVIQKKDSRFVVVETEHEL